MTYAALEQPHERVARGRQLLQGPAPLPDHGDQLLAGSAAAQVAPGNSDARAPVETQNATSARSRCEPSWANNSSNRPPGICLGVPTPPAQPPNSTVRGGASLVS